MNETLVMHRLWKLFADTVGKGVILAPRGCGVTSWGVRRLLHTESSRYIAVDQSHRDEIRRSLTQVDCQFLLDNQTTPTTVEYTVFDAVTSLRMDMDAAYAAFKRWAGVSQGWLVIGSPKAENDLLLRLRDEGYPTLEIPAVTPEGVALFPEIWTEAALCAKQAELGDTAFARSFLLRP
jgi:hypothetical protein